MSSITDNNLSERLTTPHGDQKPFRPCGTILEPHYPSYAHVRGTEKTLTTPHGDQKRQALWVKSRFMGYSHYPSWGSETRQDQSQHLPVAGDLTTPHGDQKRPVAFNPDLGRSL